MSHRVCAGKVQKMSHIFNTVPNIIFLGHLRIFQDLVEKQALTFNLRQFLVDTDKSSNFLQVFIYQLTTQIVRNSILQLERVSIGKSNFCIPL